MKANENQAQGKDQDDKRQETQSPNLKVNQKATKDKDDQGKLSLTQMNESASKKKKQPFEYQEKDIDDDDDDLQKPFSLKDLDPEQMREINKILEEYIEVPRAHSLPKRVFHPSPDLRPEALADENLTDMQRTQLIEAQMYYQERGIKMPHRYEYDIKDVQQRKQAIEEFVFYRKKFEKSQRAKAANADGSNPFEGKMGLDLNKEMFDP